MSKYAYMLRFTLQPGHWEEERLEALIDFCRKGKIDDVMFFIAPLNLRHITREETKPWMDMIGRAKGLLERIGVTTSINPLNTLLHDSANNTLLEGQNFRLMVDPNGNQSTTAVCPLCPEWRSYIIELYAYYATLQPNSLWVEDDFRFHNHSPLQWGGCFCEDHMRAFAREAGVASINREDFVQGVLASGEPHEYRRIWLDSCRQTMVELAEAIGEAVHHVSPETRIGLMTSDPSVHAAEGRDWHGIMKAFDGNQRAIIRPNLPAYMETSGIHYSWAFNAVSRLTAALIPDHTEAFPELENVPYTSYSKSKSFQKYQLETALLLGSRGITLNMIDMIGNGLYPEEQSERWLAEEKDFLNSIASLDLHVQYSKGVQVLVSEHSSYHLHTTEQSTMEALYPRETWWTSLLSAYGVANEYAVEWPKREGVLALSGQILRNYDEAQIRELFKANFVLLDGEAVYTLYTMGLGSLCGVSQAVWREVQTIEQIVNGHVYSGIKEGRMRPYLSIGRYLDIQYEQGSADVISEILSVQSEAICPGMTVVNGRIFILPYGQDGQEGTLNPIRCAVLQETITAMGTEETLMITSYSPHAAVYEFRSATQQSIAIVNNSMDDIDGIELAGADLTDDNWTLFSRFEPMGQPIALRSSEHRTVVKSHFPALTLKVLHRQI
ncbi:hypothetical protein Back11_29060 [Paenibacillus baekrokdamisoli]|uniref:Uncharacterized protein n=1 Tax=Paenibacillus baekrokdamisoli TaxID=1712516 RepID=A0A3G9J717_9BACL|nr:hypothetical protein [Paenibacillus baekrokdamisoli]MBB3071142.1 hypothetical protein [Paenibacillus baekrokdamisoli]BBH21561.1 hypothetical protein Back11_29060 [Paenibacillus baekrokdamisoli]